MKDEASITSLWLIEILVSVRIAKEFLQGSDTERGHTRKGDQVLHQQPQLVSKGAPDGCCVSGQPGRQGSAGVLFPVKPAQLLQTGRIR